MRRRSFPPSGGTKSRMNRALLSFAVLVPACHDSASYKRLRPAEKDIILERERHGEGECPRLSGKNAMFLLEKGVERQDRL